MRSAALVVCAAATLFAQAGKNVVLRSMTDELERSRKLSITGLEAPYFIEYTMEDVWGFSTSASLGSTITTSENRVRLPRVKLRVGDYKFDNTNYLYSDFSPGSRYDPEQFVVDDDYKVLRRGWWLATDRAYKGALAAIARKRAAIKNMTVPEAIPDFWQAPPLKSVGGESRPDGKPGEWPGAVRTLSGVFKAFPEIVSSGVSFSHTRSVYYMVNSEGSMMQRPEPLLHLQAQASAMAADGMMVRDSMSVPRLQESALPQMLELSRRTGEIAENVRALVKAPAGESYSGPVLFEGVAGAQVIAELLAPNFALGRRPIGEPGRQVPYLASELEGRLESRILPEFLDVVDDPTKKEWQGSPLLGSYEADEEGVAAKPVTLVQKGRLKSFLLTRQPVKGFEASNGRARLPGAFGAWSASISNLFVTSSESVKGAELRQKLIKMVQDRSKPYGIIVRKFDFPSSATNEEARRLIAAAQQSGAVRPVSAPVLIYKVFPDGREELVRGLRFRGLSLRSLRDITAVSEESFSLHYLNNLLPFALLSGAGYVAPVSVVAPSMLFDDLELERPRDDVPTLPVVPAPPLTPVSAARR